MIIFGGISSLFAFGCIVAEGVYTRDSFLSIDNDFRSRNHRSARNYIKKSIEDLYKQAKSNLEDKIEKESLSAELNIQSWSQMKNKLGTYENGHIITYNTLWPGNSIMSSTDVPFTLYSNNGFIYAKSTEYSNIYTKVAVYRFAASISYQETIRVCWYTDKNTSLSCKNFKNKDKVPYEDEFDTLDNDYYVDENIVVGDYYSEKEADHNGIKVDYNVQKFPFAFKTFSYNDFTNNDIQNASDSSRHYKISGKKWAEAWLKDRTKFNEDVFYITKSKPSSLQDAYDKCDSYSADEDESSYPMCDDYEFDDVSYVFIENYKDSEKGKVAPYIKKYYKNKYKSEFNDLSWYPGLYMVAMINLIIQIFGIIIWACGTFIPNGEDKMPSEGEA